MSIWYPIPNSKVVIRHNMLQKYKKNKVHIKFTKSSATSNQDHSMQLLESLHTVHGTFHGSCHTSSPSPLPWLQACSGNKHQWLAFSSSSSGTFFFQLEMAACVLCRCSHEGAVSILVTAKTSLLASDRGIVQQQKWWQKTTITAILAASAHLAIPFDWLLFSFQGCWDLYLCRSWQ